MYSIDRIEDAILQELSALKELGVKTIKSYTGEINENISNLVIQFPAIYVVYAGSEYIEHGARKIEKMRWTFFVCDRNLRSEEKARRGGAGSVGVYILLAAIRDILYGNRLNMDIFPFSAERQELFFFEKGIVVYRAEYITSQVLLYP